MADRSNPFHEQIIGKYFVGREDEIETFGRSLEGLGTGAVGHAFVAGVHGTGKTFFLDKLMHMANEAGFAGALTSLDEASTPQAAIAKCLRAAANAIDGGASGPVTSDWDKGKDSRWFRQPKLDTPDSDAIRDDLDVLVSLAEGAGQAGLVICIDEGQRVPPPALSALKNALQRTDKVLVVLSLRLPTDTYDVPKAGRAALDHIAQAAEKDIGASRIFITEFGMGPFRTHEEAHRCITKRLDDNIVKFDTAVIAGIVELSERVPRTLIRYASKVWDEAFRTTSKVAEHPTLARVVRSEHPVESELAQGLAASLSTTKLRILEAILSCDGTATIEDVINRLVHDSNGSTELLREATEAELNDLTRDYAALIYSDDRYRIPSAIDRFAMRAGMEEL